MQRSNPGRFTQAPDCRFSHDERNQSALARRYGTNSPSETKPLYIRLVRSCSSIVSMLHSWLPDDLRTRISSLSSDSAPQIGRATSELQSLMRISYAVFCLNKTKALTRVNNNKITHTMRKTIPNL